MARTLTPSAVLTDYLETCDSIRNLADSLKRMTQREKSLRADVIDAIGETGERVVRHGDAIAKLRIGEKVSYSLAVDEPTAVEYCVSHGIPVDQRSELWLSSAKRAKYGRESVLPAEILSAETERIIIVS